MHLKKYGAGRTLTALGTGLFMFFMAPQYLKDHYTSQDYIERLDTAERLIIGNIMGKVSRDEVANYLFNQIRFFEENKPEHADSLKIAMWEFLQGSKNLEKTRRRPMTREMMSEPQPYRGD